MSFARKILRVVRPFVEAGVRWVIAHRAPRALFNLAYRRLGDAGYAVVYNRTAKLFRGHTVRAAPGSWAVPFVGHLVRLPLHPARMWLDWDQAMSVRGHEPAVKETYKSLLEADLRPDLFVDVGANYGTHSLLFLTAGVRTITFEPNETCHEYFREACSLNRVTPRLEAVALGDAPGEVELLFPPDQTWLGTTDPRVVERLRREGKLESRWVPLKTLDAYADVLVSERPLVKIDAEGHELAILRGAQRILAQVRPMVIFESLRDADRAGVHDLFESARYRVATLPFRRRPDVVAKPRFLASDACDFVAIPVERWSGA